MKSAKAMLDGRENDGAGSSNDGFYESKREWMGRRHFTLALEGYVVLNDEDIYFSSSRKRKDFALFGYFNELQYIFALFKKYKPPFH